MTLRALWCRASYKQCLTILIPVPCGYNPFLISFTSCFCRTLIAYIQMFDPSFSNLVLISMVPGIWYRTMFCCSFCMWEHQHHLAIWTLVMEQHIGHLDSKLTARNQTSMHINIIMYGKKYSRCCCMLTAGFFWVVEIVVQMLVMLLLPSFWMRRREAYIIGQDVRCALTVIYEMLAGHPIEALRYATGGAVRVLPYPALI